MSPELKGKREKTVRVEKRSSTVPVRPLGLVDGADRLSVLGRRWGWMVNLEGHIHQSHYAAALVQGERVPGGPEQKSRKD